MIFLRILLMFVFVFLLLNISKSNAGKIKNCSNCSSDKANINNKKTNFEETFWQNTIQKYTDTILCIKYNASKLKNSKKLKKNKKNAILGILNKSKGNKQSSINNLYLKEINKRNLNCKKNSKLSSLLKSDISNQGIYNWKSATGLFENNEKILPNSLKPENLNKINEKFFLHQKKVIRNLNNFVLCTKIKNNNNNKINELYVIEANYRGLNCSIKETINTVIASKPKYRKQSISSLELEKEKAKRKALEKRIAELEKKNKELQQPKKQKKVKPKSGSGSGFFISKLGHIITNQHVVNKCDKITIGDHIDKQVPAKLLETDRENDLALLRTTNIKMASPETQSLIRKLSIEIVPLASGGLMRKSDVKGGEDVIVAGFPYGVMFSKTIKVTKGIVSSTRGVGDDSGQFQIDAAVQPGNSGGPIYDRYGNIVGVVVAQLNKFKMAKSIGSLPENVNFGIKASTVSQFLNTSGVITNWAKRTKPVSNEKLFDIASKQTVMVVCHRE